MMGGHFDGHEITLDSVLQGNEQHHENTNDVCSVYIRPDPWKMPNIPYAMNKLKPVPNHIIGGSIQEFVQRTLHLIHTFSSLRKDRGKEVCDIKIHNMGWCPNQKGIRVFDIDYQCETPSMTPVFIHSMLNISKLKLRPRDNIIMVECQDIIRVLSVMLYERSRIISQGEPQTISKWTSLHDGLCIIEKEHGFWYRTFQNIFEEIVVPYRIYIFCNIYKMSKRSSHLKHLFKDKDQATQRVTETIERSLMACEDKSIPTVPPLVDRTIPKPSWKFRLRKMFKLK